MANNDAEKGRLVMDAFRFFKLNTKERMTVRMLTAYFEEHDLNLGEMESGLNYTRLQGWTENGPHQSAILTHDGERLLH